MEKCFTVWFRYDKKRNMLILLDVMDVYVITGRVLTFVFTDPLKHLALCLYWICVICASVLRFYNISKHSKIERILLRKYYHLVAVLMFLPALLFQVYAYKDYIYLM